MERPADWEVGPSLEVLRGLVTDGAVTASLHSEWG
jgi:hypothetical protein